MHLLPLSPNHTSGLPSPTRRGLVKFITTRIASTYHPTTANRLPPIHHGRDRHPRRGAPPTAICPHSTAILLRMPDRWTHPMFLKLQRVLYDDDVDRNGVARMRRQHELVRSLVPADRLLEHRVGDGWAQRCARSSGARRRPGGARMPACRTSTTATPGRAATSVGCAACSARSSRRVLDLAAYAALAWVVLSQVPARLW